MQYDKMASAFVMNTDSFSTNRPQTDVAINSDAEQKPTIVSQAINPPGQTKNWDEITLNETGNLPKS